MDSPIKKKRARGRLSREMIEDAAFEVIEREGLAGFSMRKLAAALGCEAMSIYHHFPSQAHLHEALVDRLIGALEMPDAGLPWRQRMRMAMQDFRRIGREHPAFAPFLVTYRMNSPTCLAWLNSVISLFEAGGFGTELGARLFRTVGYYLMGAILDETSGYARGPSAVSTTSTVVEPGGRTSLPGTPQVNTTRLGGSMLTNRPCTDLVSSKAMAKAPPGSGVEPVASPNHRASSAGSMR